MPYRPRSTVTRQLTEEESALEERAKPFLQSSSPMPEAFNSAGSRYAWMKRDLEMRDMQARTLQNESSLAGDLGDKRGMAAQNTKETDDDIAAQKGLDLMANKVAQGITPKQARLDASRELGLDMNDAFHSRAKEREDVYETPNDAKRRQQKDLITGLELDDKQFDAEAKAASTKGDDAKKRAIDTYINEANAKGFTAENTVAVANAQKMRANMELDDTTEKYNRRLKLGSGTENDINILRADFNDEGWGGLTHPERLVKRFSGPENNGVLKMLSNSAFRERNFKGKDDAETKKLHTDFTTQLNDLTADEPATTDTVKHDAWREKYDKAYNLVSTLAGKHANEESALIRARDKAKLESEINKANEVSSKEVSTAFKEASKEILDSFSMKTAGTGEPADPALKASGMVSSARTFLARAQHMNPGNETLYENAKLELDEMMDPETPESKGGYLKDPGKAADEVHKIMAKFMNDQAHGIAPPAKLPWKERVALEKQAAQPAADTTAAVPAATAAVPAAATPPAAEPAPVYTPEQRATMAKEFSDELQRNGGNREAAKAAMKAKGYKF